MNHTPLRLTPLPPEVSGRPESLAAPSATAPWSSFPGGEIKIDLVLEDEVGQAMEPETDIILRLKPKVLVLTGDDHQLLPTVMSNTGKLNPFFRQLSVSLFTRLCNQGYSFHRLRTNYRMHKDLSDFPNATEYNGELVNHPSTEAPTPQSLLWQDFVAQHPALSQAQHTRRIIIDVPGASQQDQGSTSRYLDNMLKATDDFVHQFLSFHATRAGAQPRLMGKDLSIIAPYKDQRRKLNQVLIGSRSQAWDPERADVKAATIDAFQGRECPFVLANLLAIDGAAGRIGFLEDRRRLNVALTRGKHALVILLDYTGLIKHADGWASGPSKSGTTVFGKFLQDIRRKGAIIPWERFTATDPPPPPPEIRAPEGAIPYKRPHSDARAGPQLSSSMSCAFSNSMRH
jgi:senataxin